MRLLDTTVPTDITEMSDLMLDITYTYARARIECGFYFPQEVQAAKATSRLALLEIHRRRSLRADARSEVREPVLAGVG
jgi:hypothetical protein